MIPLRRSALLPLLCLCMRLSAAEGDAAQGTDEAGKNTVLSNNQTVVKIPDNKPTVEASDRQESNRTDPDLTGNPAQQMSVEIIKSTPGADQAASSVKMPGVHRATPAGSAREEAEGQLLLSSNGTGSSSRGTEGVVSMKYVTMTAFMVILGVAVMVLIIISSLTRRRRRHYDRCRGLSDDSEMCSNFRLVNHDERLGIRTSSTYLM